MGFGEENGVATNNDNQINYTGNTLRVCVALSAAVEVKNKIVFVMNFTYFSF